MDIRTLFFLVSFGLSIGLVSVKCNALTFIPTCDVNSLYDNAGGMSLDITNGYEQSYSGMYCSHVIWMTYEEFVARNAQAAANTWIGTIDWTDFKKSFMYGFGIIFTLGSIGVAISILHSATRQL